MKAKVIKLDGAAAGEIELKKEVFGLKLRKDILQRVVRWQQAKKQAGTHKTKGISEIKGSTIKPFNQKGTGNARRGSNYAPQMRGGATIFGPQVRSHAFDLPKKVRKLGLKIALSAKQADGSLKIVDALSPKAAKTKEVVKNLNKNFADKVLFIDGEKLDENFVKASRNIKNVKSLPQIGANVFDILWAKEVVLTKDAVDALTKRLA